ncbi:hypothetical protein [Marinigracilibium pacificum]|uniref:Uncharacterized protein n=1 Tax=Marinigracilibium pacificum TaxID=2729599 RepID=A0A848J3R7_9BACT|nr:hypothetical protein [Marinigracilibium pacificum]NMM47822.1 hypothetical protein [Marinigracilibium pacificum]
MILKKGFIQKSSNISTQKLITGIFLWIIFSYVLYAFFYLLRESIRVLAVKIEDPVFIILNEKEHLIYNLFYASIAIALAYIFSLKFTLRISNYSQPRKSRSLLRNTINDGGFFSWTFLFWFGKMAVFYGLWYTIYPLHNEISFLDEFPLFLFLLPLIIFLSTWPKLRLFLGKESLKWFLISIALFLTLTITFAFKDFISIENINQKIVNSSIEYSYKLEIPETRNSNKIERKENSINLFIVNDSTSNPMLFLNEKRRQIRFEQLSYIIQLERDKIDVIDQSSLMVNIFADKNLKLDVINQIKNTLRESGIRKINYSTNKINSNYPIEHPAVKYSGISTYLYPSFSNKLISFMDSIENINLTNKKISIPEEKWMRVYSVKNINRIEVKVDNENVFLNGKSISDSKLRSYTSKLTSKYSPGFAIIYSPADDISYDRYIKYLDLFYSVTDSIRNETSLITYNRPYKNLNLAYTEDLEIVNDIEKRYPYSVIEWTEDEKRLMKLLNKQGK